MGITIISGTGKRPSRTDFVHFLRYPALITTKQYHGPWLRFQSSSPCHVRWGLVSMVQARECLVNCWAVTYLSSDQFGLVDRATNFGASRLKLRFGKLPSGTPFMTQLKDTFRKKRKTQIKIKEKIWMSKYLQKQAGPRFMILECI